MNVAAQKQCNCSPPHLHTEDLLNRRPGERPPLRNHLGTIRCGKTDPFELTNFPPPVSGLTDAVDLSAILRLSVLQVRKLQDKVSKCQEAVKKSKENYELALLDITNYNSR